MASVYRIKYCPPNPGWNSRKLKQNRWFNTYEDLVKYIEEHPNTNLSDIWVSHNGKKFVKFNINKAI